MKTPQEFIPLLNMDKRQMEVLIELVQKDAYNQAIEDAAKVARTREATECWSGQVWDDGPLPTVVDKESILKLKMK